MKSERCHLLTIDMYVSDHLYSTFSNHQLDLPLFFTGKPVSISSNYGLMPI